MQNAVKSAARFLFHAVGGTWLTRQRYRNGLRILMYHRFPSQSALADQCAHLKHYYHPVSLNEIAWLLHKGKRIPQQAVVFTVDDGYRDFFVNAFDVLTAYSIPAMVYLASDMLDQGTCLWVDWVRILFRAAPCSNASFALPGSGPVTFTLSSETARERAAFTTKEALKRAPNADRLRFLDRLPALLGIQQIPAIPGEYAPLKWPEVRAMASTGIEFGAHTRSHPILARLASREEIRGELAGSKARIEQELGLPVQHFCYPNGHHADFTEETIEVLKECGYLTAVTAIPGINQRDADPFRLRRIHQEPTDRLFRYAQRVAGLGS